MEHSVFFLQQEQPKICDAIKNLISLLVGLSSTASAIDIESGSRTPISMVEAVSCCQVLMRSIQHVVGQLPDDSSIWAEANPQQDNQMAVHRLDQLIQYKSVILLRNRLLDSKISVNKFFGKSLLLWANIWEPIKLHADANKPVGISDLVMEKVLTRFGSSLLLINDNNYKITLDCNSSMDTSSGNIDGLHSVEDALEKEFKEVIWSTDFTKSLALIRERRMRKSEVGKEFCTITEVAVEEEIED